MHGEYSAGGRPADWNAGRDWMFLVVAVLKNMTLLKMPKLWPEIVTGKYKKSKLETYLHIPLEFLENYLVVYLGLL